MNCKCSVYITLPDLHDNSAWWEHFPHVAPKKITRKNRRSLVKTELRLVLLRTLHSSVMSYLQWKKTIKHLKTPLPLPYIKNPGRRQNLSKLIGYRDRPKNPAAADPDQDLSPNFARNFMDLFCYLTLCPPKAKAFNSCSVFWTNKQDRESY